MFLEDLTTRAIECNGDHIGTIPSQSKASHRKLHQASPSPEVAAYTHGPVRVLLFQVACVSGLEEGLTHTRVTTHGTV